MTPAEVVANLRVFNDWRRGELDDLSMPDPREIGEAIDTAIEMIERTQELETALREFTWSDACDSQADCAQSVLGESK